jgi:hypothetical protein
VKIRCKIERKDGTPVRIGDVDYHFAPQVPNGPHVAEVSDEQHIARFLAITEGYEPLEAVEVAGMKATVTQPVELATTEVHIAPDYSTFTRPQLEEAYEEKFGVKPHPRSKDATLVGKLTDG